MSDAKERRDEGGDQQKYEILFAKDQEMSQFIASFDDHKAEEEAKTKEKQENIIRLLENISLSLGLAPGMTPEGNLRDMEDELHFKNRQLQNSETTQNRLEAELNKRQGELEKIESLDLKITQELHQVEDKMKQYEKDMEQKYDRVEDMRGEGNVKIRQQQERKMFLEGRLSTLKQQVGFLRLRHESRRQQLTDDETASAIEAQEQKIRQFGQTLFTLQSFIKQKSSESSFSNEMAVCLQAAAELNKMLQERRPAQCA
jgi:intraflagellar transport protein 74